MFKKLVAVEALNLTPEANSEFSKRAEEFVFYDDVPERRRSSAALRMRTVCWSI